MEYYLNGIIDMDFWERIISPEMSVQRSRIYEKSVQRWRISEKASRRWRILKSVFVLLMDHIQRFRTNQQLKHIKIPLYAIKECTDAFNERNVIGKGGYGKVYKGILTWARYVNKLVAVKRLDATGFQGNKEFHTELTMLSEYRHKNIITLIGFCDEKKELILVYEYATHGSLDTYLSKNIMSGGLSWPQLLKICIGVASALDYLHNHVAEKHRIIHRDVKSANVLLDENWNAKLSDFGLARIGLANQHNTFVITNIAGTYGYNDPQYERTGYLTKESDVYSFGVVLFEVLCGRLASVISYNDERRFLRYFAPTCYKNGELDNIIDQRIKKVIEPITLRKFSAIAYQCLQENREERPTIAEVAFQLKEAWKIQLLMDTACERPEPRLIDPNFTSYLNTQFLTGKKKREIFLKRNKRKYACEDENLALMQAMDGLRILNGVECTINCLTHRRLYLYNSEDSMLRKGRGKVNSQSIASSHRVNLSNGYSHRVQKFRKLLQSRI